MKSYLLGQYEKSMPSNLSWIDKLTLSREFGFDYLEMSIDETDEKLKRLEWTSHEVKALRDDIFESKQKINSICLSAHRKFPLGHLDKDMQNRSLDIMEKAINLASDLGVRIIQLAGYDVYYEESTNETAKIFEENLYKCVELASTKGVMLGFETMETSFMDTVKKAMHYVNIINSPYLGVYPDIGNLKNASLIYNHSVNDDIKSGEGHIFAAHLKETIPNHYREIEFGRGHTEFKENVTLLKEMGVRMFNGEFWYVGNDDWREVCVDAVKFLRNILDDVFKM
ncbi:hexulose-6-phosphate isomerase [Candidatus Arthromitus sp. SFB-mouse-Japan]|uniref:L-ribulose-5-phosphate 3-epimerase n=1 Tax=unclassified Candidatus Neoarthromitus TaxID=2638829 RepID=UPI00021B7D96|nr:MULTISPECIES: L-ribulose-5-phosphate 3-epimerase [unclassified Candidatus Arthromitus]EIA24507.1 Putative hexulose-6-phosphate isomerase [Candidatus Arthromitus sp. SFB-1]EIA24713.1 Putative hexulose-6-phosphate isomerase [Candidatus Arthromitus sp. SFB-2]EIA28749.1 Putative hexulose-6-phosphate isomerase [Candidatus Arthromitus sp. SFB-co]EIA29791.1 Putative hexulose-6-phosphate isomerase [Candidatus Arthromitus sp. SFB-4]EIA31039.1 Putative hexulose-6-phosphate isomerase [Candidatus Arthr